MFIPQTSEPIIEDSYGRSICVVADQNDDSVPEFAIADGRWNQGIVVVDLRSGKTQRRLWRSTIKSDDVDCVTLTPIGDMTGDAKADLILAAWNVGVIHILSGADGSVTRTIRSSIETETSTYFGMHVCTADFTGDKIPDIAVSELLGDSTQFEAHAYVFSGKDGSRLSSVPLGNVLIKELETNFDFDRDGTPDLAVLASDASATSTTPKRNVIIFSGKTGTQLKTFEWSATSSAMVSLASTPALPRLVTFERGFKDEHECARIARFVPDALGHGMQFLPMTDCAGFQSSLCVASDLNGDGIEDIIRGDHDARFYQGEVVAYCGKDGSRIWKVDGTNDLGAAVASGIDFDGDKVPDVLAGAVQLHGYEHNGSVWGISGRTGKELWTLTRASP